MKWIEFTDKTFICSAKFNTGRKGKANSCIIHKKRLYSFELYVSDFHKTVFTAVYANLADAKRAGEWILRNGYKPEIFGDEADESMILKPNLEEDFKCKLHPSYKAIRPPKSKKDGCYCLKIWEHTKNKEYTQSVLGIKKPNKGK